MMISTNMISANMISVNMVSANSLLIGGLSLFLGLGIFAFIFRIVLTWYPQVELQRFPFSLIYYPTEPFLGVTRQVIPPIGGVDITPIVWVAIVSLVRELLLGQQGLLTLMAHH